MPQFSSNERVSQACHFALSVFCPRREFHPCHPVSLPRDSPEGRKDMSRVDGWTPLVRTGSVRSSALVWCRHRPGLRTLAWPLQGRQLSVCGTSHWSSCLLNTRRHTLKFGARGPNRKSGCGSIVFFPLWR